MQHHLFDLTLDGQLYLCPAGQDESKPLGRVLDAGTGTGIWAIDFGPFSPSTFLTAEPTLTTPVSQPTSIPKPPSSASISAPSNHPSIFLSSQPKASSNSLPAPPRT